MEIQRRPPLSLIFHSTGTAHTFITLSIAFSSLRWSDIARKMLGSAWTTRWAVTSINLHLLSGQHSGASGRCIGYSWDGLELGYHLQLSTGVEKESSSTVSSQTSLMGSPCLKYHWRRASSTGILQTELSQMEFRRHHRTHLAATAVNDTSTSSDSPSSSLQSRSAFHLQRPCSLSLPLVSKHAVALYCPLLASSVPNPQTYSLACTSMDDDVRSNTWNLSSQLDGFSTVDAEQEEGEIILLLGYGNSCASVPIAPPLLFPCTFACADTSQTHHCCLCHLSFAIVGRGSFRASTLRTPRMEDCVGTAPHIRIVVGRGWERWKFNVFGHPEGEWSTEISCSGEVVFTDGQLEQPQSDDGRGGSSLVGRGEEG